MEQKGSLPTTGQIDFVLNEVQLGFLKQGLINQFSMDAIISWPDNPLETKKKIKLYIEAVKSPGSVRAQTVYGRHKSNFLNENTMQGVSRTQIYLMDKILFPSSWILFGKLQGDNPIPIVILFYPQLTLGIYSFKRKEETLMQFNPQMN